MKNEKERREIQYFLERKKKGVQCAQKVGHIPRVSIAYQLPKVPVIFLELLLIIFRVFK